VQDELISEAPNPKNPRVAQHFIDDYPVPEGI
jgi:hypothetical protein